MSQQTKTENPNPLATFDTPILKGMTPGDFTGRTIAFLPATMGEAMEVAKLMSASNFVPPHLRRMPGDCLALVMFASRVGMDPFMLANKTYFVNERMAFEAQAIDAMLNVSGALEERLTVEWDGEGQNLTCKVSGKIRGETNIHEVWQELKDIKTQNSPLWKSSPRQQLAYYTKRMWGRLHAPEILMGVYTPDEIVEGIPQSDGSEVLPPRPTRQSIEAEEAAAQRLAKEQRAAEDRAANRIPEDEDASGDVDVRHDPETGEVKDTPEPTPATDPEPETDESPIFVGVTGGLIEKIKKTGSVKALNNLIGVVEKQNIEALPEKYRLQVQKAIDEKRAWFARP